jgi:hypothetical protein
MRHPILTTAAAATPTALRNRGKGEEFIGVFPVAFMSLDHKRMRIRAGNPNRCTC